MFVATRYATKTMSSSNVLNSILLNGVYLLKEYFMDNGHHSRTLLYHPCNQCMK